MDDLKKLLENAGVPVMESDGDLAYNVEDASGDGYAIYYREHDGMMFAEKNGVGIASATIEGGGVGTANVRDPAALMEAVFAFAENNDR